MNQTLVCLDEDRRRTLHEQGWNGLDYVEVTDDPPSLCVHFFGPIPDGLTAANLRITGGRRVRDLKILSVQVNHADDPELDDCLNLTLDQKGDFSTYTLCLVSLPPVLTLEASAAAATAFPGFDPRYLCVDFRFRQDCPSDLDCKDERVCPPDLPPEPDLNYLAKDYESFRQLILDRLNLLMPDWQERHVPDLGITLVELLAYTGDYLSYYQDAVGTEAYLGTARQRISVRRHGRLVDYRLHEGCNARAWVCVSTNTDVTVDPAQLFFITKVEGLVLSEGKLLAPTDLQDAALSAYEAFEPLVDPSVTSLAFWATHDEIPFYTWGDELCCLPKGSTEATLLDEISITSTDGAVSTSRALHLQVGDDLLLEEVLGPDTGNPADADPTHRCVVRLTRVVQDVDPVYGRMVLNIAWSPQDALPFPLCLSSRLPAPDCGPLANVSVARGNVVLVDHGLSLPTETLGVVPTDEVVGACACEGAVVDVTERAGAFEPTLQRSPLTYAEPLPPSVCASPLLLQDPREALPQVRLFSVPSMKPEEAALLGPEVLDDPTTLVRQMQNSHDLTAQAVKAMLSLQTRQLIEALAPDAPLDADLLASLQTDLHRLIRPWWPRYDLIESEGDDAAFVVEEDDQGIAHLRFGDGELGLQPVAGATFKARYRLGNGPDGNVGAEAIRFAGLRQGLLDGVTLKPRNPLPAQGGTPQETTAQAKLLAPTAFLEQIMRAITAADYATLAERQPALQGADAKLAWMGSWYEARVAVDPLGTETPDPAFLEDVEGALHPYRRMGHDLEVVAAEYVPLDIELTVCVRPDYLRGHVEAALLQIFSDRALPDGSLGFFHPDRLGFGDGVYLSQLVAAAQAAPGVQHVEVTRLERLYEGPNGEIEKGLLPLGTGQIAQVDNDPDFPEHGQFHLVMRGGR
ncbi:hypothetical protein GETHLI_26450 [Geothrix limicola]|uniref:Baseplate assembly protein n=1 Tax=Geothrix limicola TaxID=2927978 RepID=A0ABQ5QIH1_9BACT|nr:putative baseplate assembly protein [Geothrix limicola]GLH74143.1 hypothetical protein GETHLI_26450 [Geothrix limicola]